MKCGVCNRGYDDCFCGIFTPESERVLVYKGKSLVDILKEHKKDKHDPVHHPAHYEVLPGVEAKDIIQAILNESQGRMTSYQAYCLGNILKYSLRCMKKGSPEENLKKAKTYIDYFLKEE